MLSLRFPILTKPLLKEGLRHKILEGLVLSSKKCTYRSFTGHQFNYYNVSLVVYSLFRCSNGKGVLHLRYRLPYTLLAPRWLLAHSIWLERNARDLHKIKNIY